MRVRAPGLAGAAALVIALVVPLGAAAQPVVIDRLLATVGGRTITASDVALARALGLFDFTPVATPIAARDVERLVRVRLVLAEAERLAIEVEPSEVEAAWRALAERHGGDAALAAWLAEHAVEPAWARRMLRDHLRHARFIELRFRAFVFVPEQDVTAALGPGEHEAAARDRARDRLRSEAAARAVAEWLEEAAGRVPIHRWLAPDETF
jgi:hypothetical protein